MRSLRPAIVQGITLGVFLGALFFRLATFSITNDDYLHLSLAQQVLLGDVPVRDFIDPGEFLFYYASAAAQVLGGRHLLSEVLLDVLMLAVGYALVYRLAQQASRSHVIALGVTVVAILLVPRLYSYPKIVLYGVGLSLLWRYADGRRVRQLLGLALFTGFAFLVRHDHGSYLGGASALLIALVHRDDGWRASLRAVAFYGSATVAVLLPFLIFLQINGGVVPYWRNTMETGRAEYQRTVGRFPPFSSTLASPRIRVRWTDDLDAAARTRLTARYRLSAGADEGNATWQYDLGDRSRANVAALLADPRVADTSGIDRELRVVTARAHEPNVDAWFYYLTIALPPLALLAVAVRRRQAEHLMSREPAKIIALCALAIVMHIYLLRAASDSAIADVSVPTAVLGAWLIACGLRSRLTAVAVVAVLAVTVAAVSRSDGWYMVEQLALGTNAVPPIPETLDRMRRLAPPFDDEGARYLAACTRVTDRLLITGYVPHVHYQSGRGFAAGRPYFLGSFAPSAEFERFSLSKLEAQRVPIVLATSGEDYAAFAGTTPLIHAYLQRHYRDAGVVTAGGARFRVLVDTRLPPAGTHGDRELPCF